MDKLSSAGWSANIAPMWASGMQINYPAPDNAGNQRPAVLGDRVDLTPGVGPAATPAAPAFAPASTHAASPTVARPSVPVNLMAEDFDTQLVGSRPSNNPLAGLGVLAQLDETTPVEAVRAVDGLSRSNLFSDLNLVGPGNAGQHLGNPETLYLG